MPKSDAQEAGLSFAERRALAEGCLRTLVEEAGPFANLETPQTYQAFLAISRGCYGADATASAIYALKRSQVLH